LIYFNHCKIILVHMALSNDCKLTPDRVLSRTDEFLKSFFPKTHMTLKDFRTFIEKKNSDLFFIFLIYLLLRTPFNDEILTYYKYDRRMEKLKKRVKWTEKINVVRYTDNIKIFIGVDAYNRLTNTVEVIPVNLTDEIDQDEAEFSILDEEYGISELNEFVVIPPFRNPHFCNSKMSISNKQNNVISTNKDKSTEATSIIFEYKANSKLLDMVLFINLG
jgi:hypothetical protein